MTEAAKQRELNNIVAIPSSRVNVSYYEKRVVKLEATVKESRNPLKSGQCFLRGYGGIKNFLLLKLGSQSPQVGSMFPTLKEAAVVAGWKRVAIPSSRVNVSYSTHLFLRIIGNLTPLLREPHYFYAFFFPL